MDYLAPASSCKLSFTSFFRESCASAVEYIGPAAAVSHASPAPAVLAAPVPVDEHVSPVPAVRYAAPAPVVEYTSRASGVLAAPAPVCAAPAPVEWCSSASSELDSTRADGFEHGDFPDALQQPWVRKATPLQFGVPIQYGGPVSHRPSPETHAPGFGMNRNGVHDVLQQPQYDRHLHGLHTVRSRHFEELTHELATGSERTNVSMQLNVGCGQDGDFIGMISPIATGGAPLAFPSASEIAEVTLVSYPRQVRQVIFDGRSSDGK